MISKPIQIIAVVVALVVVIGIIALVPSGDDDDEGTLNDLEETDLVEASLPTAQGDLIETESYEVPLDFSGAMVHHVTVTLRWTDDMLDTLPDEFELTLTSGGLTETSKGTGGVITVAMNLEEGTTSSNTGGTGGGGCCGPDLFSLAAVGNDTAEVVATIKLIDSGDGDLGPMGRIKTVDSGNDWTLETSFLHCSCCPPV